MAEKDILIVDDDESIQNLFELAAKKFNINIVTALNGSEALSKCEKQDFKMVMTDLNMPKMNGVDFIKRLREMPQYRNFPIMIITGNLAAFDSKIAYLDKVHVIEKPIKLKTIQNIFSNLFPDSSSTQKLKIDKKSLFDKLVQAFCEKTSTLVEIITKDKPLYEVSEDNVSLEQIADNFFVSYPIKVWGQKFMIIFGYESKLAKEIVDKFHLSQNQKNPDDQTYAISLQKVSDMLVKKSLEMIDHDLNNIRIRIPTTVGNLKEKNKYVFPLKLDHRTMTIKNVAGNLVVHIISEE